MNLKATIYLDSAKPLQQLAACINEALVLTNLNVVMADTIRSIWPEIDPVGTPALWQDLRQLGESDTPKLAFAIAMIELGHCLGIDIEIVFPRGARSKMPGGNLTLFAERPLEYAEQERLKVVTGLTQLRSLDADYELPSDYKRINDEVWRKDNRIYLKQENGVWNWETYRPDPPKTGSAPTLDAAISAAEHALRARFDSIELRGEMYDELADEAQRRGMDVVELIHTLAGEFAYKALERKSARSAT